MGLLEFWNSGIYKSRNASDWNTKKYHSVLCSEVPDFLEDYISLPVLQRLSKVSLLCGTDFTPLFKNHFSYSRLDHSIGTALIVWNFTHDKKQTLAALFHDVSTPAFSHVSDFKNGDALKQESTESFNKKMIESDMALLLLLKRDGIRADEVNDYHKYPVADNDRPGLSADRLEYMYPSGASMDKVWTLAEIEKNYSSIRVLENEKGLPELGFIDLEQAVLYTEKFCEISLFLQRNEDKCAMQLMAEILTCAVEEKIADEESFYLLGEAELVSLFSEYSKKNPHSKLSRLFNTYIKMNHVIHSEVPLENCFCVNLDVKARYVDPLVKTSDEKAVRVSKVDARAEKCISDFLSFRDTKYGCVPYAGV